MQKDDLDAPGNAQTIVTMDYICAGTVPACSLGRCVVQAPFTCTLSSLLVSSLKCPEWWVITTILAISWYFCTSVHFSMAWLWRSLSQCIKPTRICRGSSSISSNILLSSSQSFLSPSWDHHLLGSPKKKVPKKNWVQQKIAIITTAYTIWWALWRSGRGGRSPTYKSIPTFSFKANTTTYHHFGSSSRVYAQVHSSIFIFFAYFCVRILCRFFVYFYVFFVYL